KESSVYTGRRMTLYRDPDVKFGGIKVGGIKISHLSHIDKKATLVLTETKGKRAPHDVAPLADDAPATTARAATASPSTPKPTPDQLRALGEAFTAAGVTDGPGKAAFINETLGRQTRGWDD